MMLLLNSVHNINVKKSLFSGLYQITQEAAAHWKLENNKSSDILKDGLQFLHKKYTNCKITAIYEYMNNML